MPLPSKSVPPGHEPKHNEPAVLNRLVSQAPSPIAELKIKLETTVRERIKIEHVKTCRYWRV